MLVKLVTSKCDHGEIHELAVNSKNVARIRPLCDCPEDATIERDLISGHQIISLMEQAYEAGKKGEEFIDIYEDGGEE